MTVKQLKEIIENLPDEDIVAISAWQKDSLFALNISNLGLYAKGYKNNDQTIQIIGHANTCINKLVKLN